MVSSLAYQIDADTICEVGDPKEAICETVDKLNIDMLVVGSHGKGALTRYALGFILKLSWMDASLVMVQLCGVIYYSISMSCLSEL